jgi:hypothetical protein
MLETLQNATSDWTVKPDNPGAVSFFERAPILHEPFLYSTVLYLAGLIF